jgi:HK97 family phage prohead protease/HK97 family phage major capsid protein
MDKTIKYDFSGYATRVGLKCSDGRTIMQDAFQANDGQVVPLVWQHLHNEPANILGHALLENRPDGVYAYCSLNESASAKDVKEAIKHGDIKALSIYANSLVEKGKNVVHGLIREVSLVIAGANAGAYIDNLSFQHGDGSVTEDETEAIISANLDLELFHAEEKPKENMKDKPEEIKHEEKEETIGDVFETLTEKQKTVVYAMIAEALNGSEEDAEDEEEIKQSDIKGDSNMKKNVFDNSTKEGDNTMKHAALTQTELREILDDARRSQSSLKNAFLAHGFDTLAEAYMSYQGTDEDKAIQHSITDIGYLFPDYKATSSTPQVVARRTEWVSKVFGAAKHIPFARIKTLVADLTPDSARALGYIKGEEKVEEVFALLKRTTDPQTVYKKQKIDRDDLIDITDFDVVMWLRNEMRMMLEEELARAILVSDGRSGASDDKISESKIRPIALDDDLYTVPVNVEATGTNTEPTTAELIDAIIRARADYRGNGIPTFFTTSDILSDMLLLKDSLGRRIHNTVADLAAALRVADIVEVPVMTGIVNPDTSVLDYSELAGVLVNMNDYSIGADKGGGIQMMDDFDIDFNQYKYLIETRVSGALTVPHSALAIWIEKPEPVYPSA